MIVKNRRVFTQSAVPKLFPGTYYIKKNEDDTYSATKSPWYAGFGKVVASFIPYGDTVSYVVEGWLGVKAGTSKTNENDVLIGALQESLFSKETLGLLADGVQKVAKKALAVYQVYETSKTIYNLGSISYVDKISFDFMNAAGVSTTASSIDELTATLGATTAFIGKYSGYFTDEFQYSLFKAKTPYEIDYDLSTSKDLKQFNEKVNSYVINYESSLTQTAKSSFVMPAQIQSSVSAFRSWLEKSADRRTAMIEEYKIFVGN